MKRLTKAQWINLNQNNRSVLILYCEKNWPYPPTDSGSYSRLAGREGGKPSDKMRMGFEILKFSRLNYLGFYVVYYHNNITTVLELYFNQVLSSKAYFKVYF